MFALFLYPEVTQYRTEPGLKSKSNPKEKGVVYSESVYRGHTPPGRDVKMRRESLMGRQDVRMVGRMRGLLRRAHGKSRGSPSRGNSTDKSQETKEFDRVGA